MGTGPGDTIFALATGAARAAVAVVRVSGPAAGAVLTTLAGSLPRPREATLRRLRHPASGHALDHALVLWFPAPASFTGEDCAELHLHGGRAVVAAVLGALAALPGCRPAEPGAFTRRALRQGKMDLGAVEGLADLIDAETEGQRRQALRQLDGALGAWVARQRGRLLEARAAAESAIDFSDEGDVAGDFVREVRAGLEAMRADVAAELAAAGVAERLREGFVVVIAGPPNAGKSTLLNALARREVAIVSPHAGTTRDPVTVDLDLHGRLVHLVDTAGLRAASDEVEREGIARALHRARQADLVLWLHEAQHPCPPDAALGAVPVWRVATKIDLGGAAAADHAISVATGDGVAALIEALAGAAATSVGEGAVVTRARHRQSLEAAHALLHAALAACEGSQLELVVDDLHRVGDVLERLVGRIDDEDVLGAIFARFCVGK